MDNRVRIVTLPEREVAVIRFTGYASPQEVDAVTSRLQDGLEKTGIETAGQPFLMRYDTPWMPGFLRRNEVAIEIRGYARENQGQVHAGTFISREIIYNNDLIWHPTTPRPFVSSSEPGGSIFWLPGSCSISRVPCMQSVQ
ncbi:MAG: hypothetical protein EHM53_11080, partial [Methanoregulaceae archaeon]